MKTFQESDSKTFTDHLRRVFKGALDAIGTFLTKLGIHPNTITFIGLLGNLGAGVLIALGELMWGGLLAMVVGPLDALDGTMARIRNTPCKIGAYLDSVTDRYSEIFLYAGLLIYFSTDGSWKDSLLVLIAATGALMVSYTRAKAESLGYSVKVGLLTRVERYIVLIPGLIFGFPRISVWILAILTHFTSLQRIIKVIRTIIAAEKLTE